MIFGAIVVLVLRLSGPTNVSDNSWGSVNIYDILPWLVLQLVEDVFLFFSPKLQRCSGSLSYGRCPGSLLDVLL